MERLKRMAEAAFTGPRAKLVERVEGPISRRTPLTPETIRSLVGALFLLFSARRVYRAVRAGLR